MPSSQTAWMFIAWSLGLISVALIGVSIGTDHWYQYSSSATNETIITFLGLWTSCTERQLTDGWNLKDCTEREIFGDYGSNITSELQTKLHVNRSFVIFVCLSALIQLISKIIFLCSIMPWCHIKRKVAWFFVLSIFELLAAFFGIVGCICFIALQDLSNYDTANFTTEFQWSFMLAWISIGFCFIQSAIFVVLVKVCYDDVFQSGKFDYNTIS